MLFDCLKHASRDFEETQQFLANKGLESRLPGRGAADIDRRFDAIIRSTYGQNLYVAYMEYGADIEIDAAAERMDYGFSIPVGGTMASSAGDGEILGCTRTQTVLASPGQPQTMYLAGDAKRLALSVQQDLVRQRLAALTGEDVHGVIEFEPILDVTAGAGHLITSNMEMIVAQQDRGVPVFADRLREAHFEETVLSTLLLYHRHSHSWMLERPAHAPASRDVKRVIDYLHAHLAEAVTLDDLVAVAGVPGRTLNEHFRAFTGHAPMAYLRRLRLAAVRRELMAGPATSVTDVALRFGFLHLGRFSGVYRQAFGEAPSATLERGRQVMGR